MTTTRGAATPSTMSPAGLPDPVFVPGGQRRDGRTQVEVRTDIETGLPALVVFSSLDRLVTSCGELQGWVTVSRGTLLQLVSTIGVVRVVVDLPVLTGPADDDVFDRPVLRPNGELG